MLILEELQLDTAHLNSNWSISGLSHILWENKNMFQTTNQ
jgi:hypothetical protein